MNVAIVENSNDSNTISPTKTRNLIVRSKKEVIKTRIKDCIAKLMSNELNITRNIRIEKNKKLLNFEVQQALSVCRYFQLMSKWIYDEYRRSIT
jgi:hypothetical protein